MRWLTQDDFDVAFENTWRTMSEKGLALQDVLSEVSSYVTRLDVKEPINLAMLVASLSDVEHRLSVGTNEKLQLAGVVGLFVQARAGLVSV